MIGRVFLAALIFLTVYLIGYEFNSYRYALDSWWMATESKLTHMVGGK